MAFPSDHSKINTNLDPAELERIIAVLDTKGQPGVTWTKDTLLIYWCEAEFTFEGSTYEYSEEVEVCTKLRLVTK